MTHASCLVQQGAWTHWEDVRPFDLSWRNLIYGPGPKVISFVLNAQINSVKTPAMLKLWGYTETSHCPLCSQPKCTLHHILVHCDVALKQGRFTWRHDSVLSNIEHALKKLVEETNQRKPRVSGETIRNNLYQCFVRAGKEKPSKQPQGKAGLLSGANDWKLLVDYDHEKIVYPPVICASIERPDAVLWSCKTRAVILVELTCPAEEGVEAAQLRKENRYFKLVNDSREAGWRAELLTIECGARGLIGNSTWRAFVKLGISSLEATALCRRLSEVVARCSYAICLAQNSKEWAHKDLIGPLSPS
jgi:zinc-binding in reverse transcriptase